jgi:hypothetical protein
MVNSASTYEYYFGERKSEKGSRLAMGQRLEMVSSMRFNPYPYHIFLSPLSYWFLCRSSAVGFCTRTSFLGWSLAKLFPSTHTPKEVVLYTWMGRGAGEKL